ncbi:MAG: head-tail adaptor protein [Alicycliphilus sp.]|nr:head-tail adaptor protein [Alicycliphilus sp.]MBP7328098.1 head-tail adaptor protein [Alicycliphilus sp.]MBP9652176.1 head-tail adaptor protein [Brachymonas sp.]MCA0439372.1 head-tail adaptor protein [Pseudomonadota bacterium]
MWPQHCPGPPAGCGRRAAQHAWIKMRYMPGVTAQDRVIHNGTIYGIESLIDVRSDHRELVLMCKG